MLVFEFASKLAVSRTCCAYPLQIRSLRATITGLQAAAGHTADVEAAGLRQRLAQLEAVVRARDKELDKLRSIKVGALGGKGPGGGYPAVWCFARASLYMTMACCTLRGVCGMWV